MEAKPDIDFDWDDGDIENIADIEADTQEDNSLSWVGGLFDIPNSDVWIENFEFSREWYNALMYRAIQSDDNWRFENYWNEKMKRQRDGIE